MVVLRYVYDTCRLLVWFLLKLTSLIYITHTFIPPLHGQILRPTCDVLVFRAFYAHGVLKIMCFSRLRFEVTTTGVRYRTSRAQKIAIYREKEECVHSLLEIQYLWLRSSTWWFVFILHASSPSAAATSHSASRLRFRPLWISICVSSLLFWTASRSDRRIKNYLNVMILTGEMLTALSFRSALFCIC